MSRDIEWSLETIMFALIFVCNNDIVSRYFEIKIVFFHINRKEQSQSKSEHINKTLEKPKCQPRIDNPEKLATLGTQDTGRRQSRDTGNIGHTRHRTKTNKTKNTTQKTKTMKKQTCHHKYVGEPKCSQRINCFL